jgi:hypothetical protein
LKFLAHFVADLHQPLHAGRPGDLGGNRIQVTWFGQAQDDGKPINLHQVWDGLVGRRAGVRPPGSATALLEEFGGGSETAVLDPRAWTSEAHSLAESVAYKLPADRALGAEYYRRAAATVRQQLWRAGTRLAALIEAARRTDR